MSTTRIYVAVKRDTWWLNWAQIDKQSPAAIDEQASHGLHVSGKSHTLGCQASCTVLLPSEPILIKETWTPISTNMTEIFSVQSELHSYNLMCIFTNQSE